MIKYSESQNQSEPLELREAVLELPDGRGFVSTKNRRAPTGFLGFCASYLPKLRQRPDYRQRRLENRCYVEFDLNHPERAPASYPAELLDELLKGL
jgi:hypothetical protein